MYDLIMRITKFVVLCHRGHGRRYLQLWPRNLWYEYDLRISDSSPGNKLVPTGLNFRENCNEKLIISSSFGFWSADSLQDCLHTTGGVSSMGHSWRSSCRPADEERRARQQLLQVRQPAPDALHVVALHRRPAHRHAPLVVVHGQVRAPPIHDHRRGGVPHRRRRQRVHGHPGQSITRSWPRVRESG